MDRQAAAHHRAKLVSIEVPADQAAAVLEQVRDILGYHAARLSGKVPLDEQMKALAFDCYTQGLLDGAQVRGRLLPVDRVPLGDAGEPPC